MLHKHACRLPHFIFENLSSLGVFHWVHDHLKLGMAESAEDWIQQSSEYAELSGKIIVTYGHHNFTITFYYGG